MKKKNYIYIYISSWVFFPHHQQWLKKWDLSKYSSSLSKKIPSVFISWAKCESAYHPSWAAYKGHFRKVKDRSCILSWHRNIVALHPFFYTASNIYFSFQTSLKCTSSTYNICRFYWFSPVFTIGGIQSNLTTMSSVYWIGERCHPMQQCAKARCVFNRCRQQRLWHRLIVTAEAFSSVTYNF